MKLGNRGFGDICLVDGKEYGLICHIWAFRTDSPHKDDSFSLYMGERGFEHCDRCKTVERTGHIVLREELTALGTSDKRDNLDKTALENVLQGWLEENVWKESFNPIEPLL